MKSASVFRAAAQASAQRVKISSMGDFHPSLPQHKLDWSVFARMTCPACGHEMWASDLPCHVRSKKDAAHLIMEVLES